MASHLDLQIVGSRSSSRYRELPLTRPADEEEDVFIPLEATVLKIKALVARDRGSPTFIRAPVAAGKSTLANHLAAKYDNEFVMVPVIDSEEGLMENIIEAGGIAKVAGDKRKSLQDALQSLASAKKTIIFDEAHLIFKFPSLVYSLFKAPQQWQKIEYPRYLLFSAATEVESGKGRPITTPDEIEKKYMWYPPMPDSLIMSQHLAGAEVRLDAESVVFLMKICSGHRGIFMKIMQWVQKLQEESLEQWGLHESVSRVKGSFTRSKQSAEGGWETGLRQYIGKSRAVRVNGQFSITANIPEEFKEVVFGGPKTRNELGAEVCSLAIWGFLVPARTNSSEEFVAYNWDLTTQKFGIANSLMAEYYGDIFAQEGYGREWTKKNPESAADLVARALPFMSFAKVVDNPIPSNESSEPMSQSTTTLKSPLSKNGLPYEDNYNDALAQVLDSIGYTVSRPINPATGKADVVVTYDGSKTCTLEGIMASRPPVSRVLCFCFKTLCLFKQPTSFLSICRRPTESTFRASQIQIRQITVMRLSKVCSLLAPTKSRYGNMCKESLARLQRLKLLVWLSLLRMTLTKCMSGLACWLMILRGRSSCHATGSLGVSSKTQRWRNIVSLRPVS